MYNKAISYSGKSLYRKCPKAFKSAYIDGVRDDSPKPAAERGTMIHDLLEKFFKGEVSYPDHVALKPWRRFMEQLTLKQPKPEGELAVDINWKPIAYDSPDAFFRGKYDLSFQDAGVVELLDWKTGKIYPEHEHQGECYVALTDEAIGYNVSMVYIDKYDEVHRYFHNARDRLKLIDNIHKEITDIRNDEEFKVTPSENACRWCVLSWRNGGTCTDAR